jgi:hypothetical protein
VRVLGISCTPKSAFLTLAVDGEVVDAPVVRVDVASQYEASAEMLATLDEIRRAFDQLAPDRVIILKPELNRRTTYGELAPRVALETLIRVAAVRADINVEVLARPTVRSRLGLAQSGKLAERVGEAIEAPVGKHWTQGRDIAGLAALAGGAS